MGLFTDFFTILVIEDNAPQVKLINRILGKVDGVQTILCGDVFEGYCVLRTKEQVDMILLDVNLPYVNGNALIRKVRAMPQYQDLPILLSTAEPSLAGEDAAGADGILTKPYDIKQLKIFIEAFRTKAD